MNFSVVSTYRYEVIVLKYRRDRSTLWEKPASITAADKDELREKVRTAFGATQDARQRWDHGYRLVSVTEVGASVR